MAERHKSEFKKWTKMLSCVVSFNTNVYPVHFENKTQDDILIPLSIIFDRSSLIEWTSIKIPQLCKWPTQQDT